MKTKRRVHKAADRFEIKRVGLWGIIYAAILLLLVSVLQTTAVPYLAVNGATFDMTLALAVFLSIYTNEYYGSVFGVIMGAVADILYSATLPIMPVVYLVLCAFCGIAFSKTAKGSILPKLLLAVGCVIVRYAIVFLTEGFISGAPFAFLMRDIIPGAVYSAMILPMVMLICCPVKRATYTRGA